MLLRSLSGVACTTPDTSKSQPTAYCFAQLKQGTCLIRLKSVGGRKFIMRIAETRQKVYIKMCFLTQKFGKTEEKEGLSEDE